VSECKGQQILIVDDDEHVREVLRLVLEKRGYSVRLAADNTVAIMNVTFHGPDLALVLLDMKMPGLDGERTLLGIRALQADLPCLVYSAFCEQDVMARMQQAGRFAYMAKPASMTALLDKIAGMLVQYPRVVAP